MLDIKFIKENKDIVKESAIKKKIKVDIDRLIDLDNQRITISQVIEEMRAQQNKVSENISRLSNEEKNKVLEEMKDLKDKMKKEEEVLNDILKE